MKITKESVTSALPQGILYKKQKNLTRPQRIPHRGIIL